MNQRCLAQKWIMTMLYCVISQNDANDGVQKNEHEISLHIDSVVSLLFFLESIRAIKKES
jgi:hypothetical protein